MSLQTYQSLITSQHRNKTKMMSTLEAKVEFYVHMQELLTDIKERLDLDNARGIFLDWIGEWVGISRYIKTPLTDVYFEWDGLSKVGWDKGVWKSEYDPETGITILEDEFYRTLIRAKIIANSWDGTIPSAYDIWESVFPNNIIIIQDNQDMTMGLLIWGPELDAVTSALIFYNYLTLKPEGVGIAFTALPPVDEEPLFCWDSEETEYLGGWDYGSWVEFLTA